MRRSRFTDTLSAFALLAAIALPSLASLGCSQQEAEEAVEELQDEAEDVGEEVEDEIDDRL